nr:MAG TPA: hypothetical protein [Caudoviricetes sp.]
MWCCRKILSEFEKRPKCPLLSGNVQVAFMI